MAANKFVDNKIYYRIGELPSGEIFVSTYIYIGHENIPDASTISCDKPFHFFVFEEYESWLDRTTVGAQTSRKLHLPSLLQANISMLTWDELGERIYELQAVSTNRRWT